MTADAWLQRMTASKIAAVVGLSPYESRFGLYHKMAGNIPPEPVNAVKSRGHYLEDGVRRWLLDQHPEWQPSRPDPDEWTELPDGRRHPLWLDRENPRFGASPDGWAHPGALIEVKTASDNSEWGEPGSDRIPAGYRAQVQWQMMVTRTNVTHVGVLTAYLNLAEYVVPYDGEYAGWLRREATAFLDSLPGGPRPQRPDLDAHGATYDAVRKLHDAIDRDLKVPVDPQIIAEWQAACADYQAAEDRKRLCTSRLLDAMGDARIAHINGTPVARRQPTSRGGVALYAIKEQAA